MSSGKAGRRAQLTRATPAETRSAARVRHDRRDGLSCTERSANHTYSESERVIGTVWPLNASAAAGRRLETLAHMRHTSLWGEAKNGRLALTRGDPRISLLTRSGSLAFPTRLPLLHPVVDIVAGGW